MDELDGHRSFADRSGAALARAGADVAGGEDAGNARLEQVLGAGRVGCCDSSPNRHATAHHHETSHPLIRSLEPGEEWSWCYVDEVALLIGEVAGETRIPPSPLG